MKSGKAALCTITDFELVTGKPGRPRSRPKTHVADKGYDDQSLRDLIRCLGIRPDIPKRG